VAERDLYAEEWITRFRRPEGIAAFTFIIRDPSDPERLERDERKAKYGEDVITKWKSKYGLQDKHVPEWRERILELLSDGIPRTFNRICLDASGCAFTADVAMEKAPDKALWGLIAEGKLQCTVQAPILFLRNE
jgi:hypothetical protein